MYQSPKSVPKCFWLKAYALVKNRTISERNEFSINIYRSLNLIHIKFSSQIPVAKLAISPCITTYADGELAGYRGSGPVHNPPGEPAPGPTGNREVLRDLFHLNSVPEDKNMAFALLVQLCSLQ